jgi:recombination protein RecA
MVERTNKPASLSSQMKERIAKPIVIKPEYDGNIGTVISTGSTLLDLAISGGRVHGGGIPGGILVEIFGPNGSGKTVLLSETAGNVHRQGGELMFSDPEARLNPTYAKLFGLNLSEEEYNRPNTIPEVFKPIRDWKPKDLSVINGVFADSLAALSTDLEMDNKEGDKMGTRRAKEFSEELRKTCRILAEKNFLLVCSNQIRENMELGHGQKYKSPGGLAIAFYSSLRLKTQVMKKIKKEQKFQGVEVSRIIGIEIEVEVFKSSIWKPYRSAPLTILFDYGIDDIRQNLQFIKDHSKNTVYTCRDIELGNAMDKAIETVESNGWEPQLKEEVISLWEAIELKFQSERKLKH